MIDYLSFLIVLCRMSAIIMFLPSIGEKYLYIRARLFIAVFISIIIFKFVKIPSQDFIFTIIYELCMGIFLGMFTRFLFETVNIFGHMVSMLSGFSAANFFDPASDEQVPAISHIYLNTVILGIFLTDTHHQLLKGAIMSYDFFPVNSFETPMALDFISKVVAKVFHVAFALSTPILMISFAVTIAGGILSRLVPSLQIFFILTPAQMLIILLLTTVSITNFVEFILSFMNQNIIPQ